MSEPESAFLKLQMSRSAIKSWLRAKPPLASRWRDWRAIGGRWGSDGGPIALADASDAQLSKFLQEADTTLSSYPDNRELLHELITETAETPEMRLSAYDDRGATFVAGSLTYSENLHGFIVFLALARGAADYLAPADHGLAIIHNYLWGSATTAAVRMMPSRESQFMQGAALASVVPAFQPIADALAEDRLPDGSASVTRCACSAEPRQPRPNWPGGHGLASPREGGIVLGGPHLHHDHASIP